jgi:hypothetical protein
MLHFVSNTVLKTCAKAEFMFLLIQRSFSMTRESAILACNIHGMTCFSIILSISLCSREKREKIVSINSYSFNFKVDYLYTAICCCIIFLYSHLKHFFNISKWPRFDIKVCEMVMVTIASTTLPKGIWFEHIIETKYPN